MKMLLVFLLGLTISSISTAQSNLSSRDSYYRWNFGSQRVYSYTYTDFTLTADSVMDLEIERISIAGMDYRSLTNCPRLLPAGQKCLIRVSFQPTMVGFSTGRVYISTKNNNFLIDLSGWGFK
jgi:hypothetical protein